MIARSDGSDPPCVPRIGDKLELIVGYSDTTVHLHEEIELDPSLWTTRAGS